MSALGQKQTLAPKTVEEYLATLKKYPNPPPPNITRNFVAVVIRVAAPSTNVR
jgi:hypothetical protein